MYRYAMEMLEQTHVYVCGSDFYCIHTGHLFLLKDSFIYILSQKRKK